MAPDVHLAESVAPVRLEEEIAGLLPHEKGAAVLELVSSLDDEAFVLAVRLGAILGRPPGFPASWTAWRKARERINPDNRAWPSLPGTVLPRWNAYGKEAGQDSLSPRYADRFALVVVGAYWGSRLPPEDPSGVPCRADFALLREILALVADDGGLLEILTGLASSWEGNLGDLVTAGRALAAGGAASPGA